jgi:DNA-directed RNA polymerase subunit M/transcription elongation factor TFIIS
MNYKLLPSSEDNTKKKKRRSIVDYSPKCSSMMIMRQKRGRILIKQRTTIALTKKIKRVIIKLKWMKKRPKINPQVKGNNKKWMSKNHQLSKPPKCSQNQSK